MSEPIFWGLQNPVQGSNLVDPDIAFDDQILPDPLLGTGWLIDADQKVDDAASAEEKPAPAETSAKPSATPMASAAIEVTPLSQRRPRRPVEEMAERPDWLPDDWKIEVRVRTSGATAGTSDRYFFSPSGLKFRSKVEVLEFLETGSRRKKKLKSDANATVRHKCLPSDGPSDQRKKTSKQASGNPSDHQKKKSKSNIRDFSDMNFDFRNPPRSLTWVQANDCPDDWLPTFSNATVPKSERTEWGNVYSRVTQLDKTNGAS
ncbi:methyl-CpG-binding domain-containing protein 5-like isoform X4 [Coffea arabica]|uniref:Methyl-CpG-binding domain-containing protein 5-like isoform X4 n=1 Tax=Coffea arabica TaxID=13443 RepID=A0ABM4WIC0_COFAR